MSVVNIRYGRGVFEQPRRKMEDAEEIVCLDDSSLSDRKSSMAKSGDSDALRQKVETRIIII